jgi:hypothetical protein
MLLLLALTAFLQHPDIDALLKQLLDESIEAREKATVLLIELGPKAEARLKAEAQTAQGEQKSRIDIILSSMARRRMIERSCRPSAPCP